MSYQWALPVSWGVLKGDDYQEVLFSINSTSESIILKMGVCDQLKEHYPNLGFFHPWRRQWHPTPVLLPGESHGWRSLVGYSPWGRWESDTTERLHFHFSLSCIGEGNGNPLQCSCLENPGDGGAWWAAIYGVAQSRTRLKWLSSSMASKHLLHGMPLNLILQLPKVIQICNINLQWWCN